jgi:hypothetical protein
VKGRFAAILAATLLAFAGCFFAPERPGGQGSPDDADLDGAGSSMGDGSNGSGAPCPEDHMDPSVMVCGMWGTSDLAGDGALARGAGTLNATVGTNGSRAECVTSQAVDFTHGASIDVVQPLQGGSGDTSRFVASFEAGGTITIQIQLVPSFGLRVSATCTGPGGFANPVAYDSSYRYLKIGVQTPGLSNVAAFHSADGQSWSTIGSCSLSGDNLALATIRFGATSGAPGSARTAKFDDFTTCSTTP